MEKMEKETFIIIIICCFFIFLIGLEDSIIKSREQICIKEGYDGFETSTYHDGIQIDVCYKAFTNDAGDIEIKYAIFNKVSQNATN